MLKFLTKGIFYFGLAFLVFLFYSKKLLFDIVVLTEEP